MLGYKPMEVYDSFLSSFMKVNSMPSEFWSGKIIASMYLLRQERISCSFLTCQERFSCRRISETFPSIDLN